ncbi:MAG TPA: deoxyribonuclease IV [Gemmatimonadales bacterium]
MPNHLFGAHTIDNGGIDMAVRRARAAGMDALQIFTTIPKFYGDRASIRPDRVARFRAALDETGLPARNVMAHSAYVLNTATHEEEKWVRAAAGLAKELERSTALGIGAICFHPGAARDGDREAAAARVARAITGALEKVPGDTRVLIENTAGAGLTMGRTPEEVAAMLDAVPKRLRARTGYGLDTCHLFAAGHPIHESKARLAGVLDAFEEATGEPPSFFHLNDSKFPFASNRDQHALIGEGLIGAAAFGWLLADRRARGVPLILETPQADFEIAEADPSPDPWDLRMLELLRSLT